MAPEQRSFVDLFAGTKELKEAFTVIGWIAVNYAQLEQRLDYLIWQLKVFECAQRDGYRDKGDEEIRALAKRLRQTKDRTSGRMQDKVRVITEHLTKKAASHRIQQTDRHSHLINEWKRLSAQLMDHQERRNQIMHSAVWWCPDPTIGLTRQSGWDRDHPNLPLDLERDRKLNSAISVTLRDLLQFTAELTHILPFKGDYTIL